MAGNNYDGRPDPDALLQRIQEEESRAQRGKLTVFLGAAAGVGKTFGMLDAARDRLREQVNVMIGWIETHGRVETERMAEGLPRIAPARLQYRGRTLEEMDVDAILAERPEIVLVDELAHTNVPGSRHVRRFQDVEELLAAGISVYTTLNIQHIESVNDIVSQITGVIVRETVPDSFVEQADNIRLIDIPPEDLIKRFKEGKVYVPSQAEQALKKFFRPGNINALRELALRFTASNVDQDMTDYMRSHGIAGPWPAAGRVMVGVSASPFSAQLIRAAKRLADGLHTDFLAVHVETDRQRFPNNSADKERLDRNMRLAEDLGAQTFTVVGTDLAQEILDVARSHNVTSLIVGKPLHSRLWELLHGSVVDKLIREGEGISVYVLHGEIEKENKPSVRTAPSVSHHASWYHFIAGFFMTAAITSVSWVLQTQLELVNIALLYLMPVLLTAVWWGRWPSYFTAVVGVLQFDFLFVPPILDFSVYDMRYIWSFVIFLIVSFLIGGRTELLRQEARMARQREKGVRALYDFSRKTAAIGSSKEIAQELAHYSGETIGRRTVVLLQNEEERLVEQGAYAPDKQSAGVLPETEYAVAVWTYEHGQAAGALTETLPGADYLFVPLVSGGNTGGVLGVFIGDKRIAAEERRLIDAWAGLSAIAIARITLAKTAKQAELLAESEKVRTILLNSISHELRTPLSGIIGVTSTLLDQNVEYEREIQRDLLETVQESAHRMDRVVKNLLEAARLESGILALKVDWCDLEDVVGAALRQLGENVQNYQFHIDVPSGLPFLKADCVLLEQVVVNLFDNAMKYSPRNSVIDFFAVQENGNIKVTVRDSGRGIAPEELERVFHKFYRAKQTANIPGTGLGLSICKSIIEAHGGKIWAENISNGTKICFMLPVEQAMAQKTVKTGEGNV